MNLDDPLRRTSSSWRSGTLKTTYENALKVLESRQRRSRPADSTTQTTPSASGTPGLRGTPSIEGISGWLRILGYTQSDLKRLNIIHVAGTKGKGSTCAFTESLLRAHSARTGFPQKTGLYTSPHLIRPEERIRINSQPHGPEKFASYLFEVVDKLPQLAADYDPARPSVVDRGPRYLQLLFLLAVHVFLREGVDVAIIETHSGGEYDATNIISSPVVTAVTTLGMDHIDMLGPTVREIAWHKAGIFKPEAVALSSAQEEEGTEEVLARRAEEKGVRLQVVRGENPALDGLPQLQPSVQRKNASLAIAVSNVWLAATAAAPGGDPSARLSPPDIRKGLTSFSWPGRFQTLPDLSPFCKDLTWFLDAAHNTLSVRIAGQWFVERSASINSSSSPAKAKRVVRMLIFTHVNELRDSKDLLRALALSLRESVSDGGMEHVVFTTATHIRSTVAATAGPAFEAWREIWNDVFPERKGENVYEASDIAAAVDKARALAKDEEKEGRETHVLVTGSQHLVGPVLEILEQDGKTA